MNRWWIVVAVSVVAALIIGFAGVAYLTPDCEGDGCPSVERLQAYRPPEPPQVFDREGELVAHLSGPRRIVLDYDEIPELLRDGYVSVEDHRFYEHGGIDWTGGLRAFVRNVRARGVEEGGSTISMQLARNVFGEEVLGYSKWHRKATEIRLAREIESQMSKEEILEKYLNQIYLGDGAYGVEAAARGYFGHSVDELSIAEAALLIGLAQSPEGYNPRQQPERARARRNTVLGILEREGLISSEEADEAREAEIELVETTRDWGSASYYIAAVRRELRRQYPHPRERSGLRVYTGLDRAWQEAAVETLVSQIRAIERGAQGTFRHSVMPDGPGSSQAVSPYLQGMLLAMEPESGVVRVLVGGRDFEHSEYDRAFQAQRQPGSAFKPIVYAAALGQGMRLTQEISTEPVRFARRYGDDWQPRDHVGGEPLSFRDALTFSSNTATARIGSRMGTDRVIRAARAFGLSTDFPPYPSIYLGAAEVVPAQLVAAFAAFGNGGRVPEPHLITRIEDPSGTVVWRARSETRQAINPALAYLTLSMMQDVVDRGTGWRVRQAGFSGAAAGKTGTTNDSKDAWFVGLTPDLVTGVWIGFDRPRTIVADGTGGNLAAPAWARFMSRAGQEGQGGWPVPPGIVEVRIDPESGWAIPEDCPIPDARTEYFLQGTEPRPFCPIRRGGWYRTEDGSWERISPDSSGYLWWTRPDSGDRGRTIFYEGEESTRDEDERRERRRIIFERNSERDRREARERRWPEPTDTVRIEDDREPVRRNDPREEPRPDTVRQADTVRAPDTPRAPDTTRAPERPPPDTVERPPADTVDAAGGAGSGDFVGGPPQVP